MNRYMLISNHMFSPGLYSKIVKGKMMLCADVWKHLNVAVKLFL